MPGELPELFKHNMWANLRLLDACEKLTGEQLDATSPGTFGSIRHTLLHIAAGEELYIHLLQGRPRPSGREDAGFQGFDQLRDLLTATGQELINLAQNNTMPEICLDTVDREVLAGSMIVIQAINHATEHRAHINSILSHLGLEPADLDGWAYGYRHDLIRPMKPGEQ